MVGEELWCDTGEEAKGLRPIQSHPIHITAHAHLPLRHPQPCHTSSTAPLSYKPRSVLPRQPVLDPLAVDPTCPASVFGNHAQAVYFRRGSRYKAT